MDGAAPQLCGVPTMTPTERAANKTIFDQVAAIIEETLATITTDNGYTNTIASVEREKASGNDAGHLKAILSIDLPQPVGALSVEIQQWQMDVGITVWWIAKETEEATLKESLLSIFGDVYKALIAKQQQSTSPRYAFDWFETMQATNEHAQDGVFIQVTINIDTKYNDITQQ